MFKNMTVGKKIIAGFTAVLALLVIVGLIAYFALNGASQGFTQYREMARDTNLAGRLQANMLMVRMNVKDYLSTGRKKNIDNFEAYWEKMVQFQAEAQKEILNPERAAKIDAVEDHLGEYHDGFKDVVEFMERRNKAVNEVLNVNGPVMENTLTELMVSAHDDNDMTAAYHSGLALKHMLLGRIYMAKFLDTNDSRAIERVHGEFENMSVQLDVLDKELQNSKRRNLMGNVLKAQKLYVDTFDELVQIIVDRNNVIAGTLDRIGPEVASNIEDVKLSIKSVQDTLGPKLVAANTWSCTLIFIIGTAALLIGGILAFIITRGITRPINRVVQGLGEGADQVASASSQVSSSSQQLAEGSSEQAASIEETSSSLEEMSSMTKQNADNANQADNLMKAANQVVDQATGAMSELTGSMADISRASEETSKIIKTIDEIAFQTNLLALNAAVEAARAGEAGAGFAVVADEVRNLAMRAADAAKNTADLIEGTVKKVTDGSDIVTKTNDAFAQVADSSSKVGELVAEIAAASNEQFQGIEQINIAVTEMDKVVQSNAANAEENASASEEMNAQAEQMQGFVGDLIAMVGARNKETGHGSGIRKPVDTRQTSSISMSNSAKEKALDAHSDKGLNPDRLIPLDEQDFQDF